MRSLEAMLYVPRHLLPLSMQSRVSVRAIGSAESLLGDHIVDCRYDTSVTDSLDRSEPGQMRAGRRRSTKWQGSRTAHEEQQVRSSRLSLPKNLCGTFSPSAMICRGLVQDANM